MQLSVAECYTSFHLNKTSLEYTVFLGKGSNLPIILQRTGSRKDAKIAKKRVDE